MLILTCTLFISRFVDKEWSNFIAISIAVWLLLDRLLVDNSVFYEKISELRQEIAKAKQDNLIQELKMAKFKTLKGSSCHF